MSTWESRIVGHAEVDPATLAPNAANWRTHPSKQRRAIAATLGGIGWVSGVMVNQRTGHLVDGHMRVEEAIRAGQEAIPVTYVDLSPDEERIVLAEYDPLGSMADANRAALDALLREVGDAGALNETLSAVAAGAGLYQTGDEEHEAADTRRAEEDEEEAPEPPRNDLRHALAIVLSNADKRRWDSYKAEIGVMGDTTAFLRLLAAGEDFEA